MLSSAVKGYQRIWEMERKGTGYVNRPGWVTKNKRRAENLTGKSTWFMVKEKPKDQESGQSGAKKPLKRLQRTNKPPKYETVLFCPYTPGSKLKKDLQEMEERQRFGEKIKFVETVRPTVASKLVSQDPWMEPCGRPSCWTCDEQPGKCMKKGLVYRISCQTCTAEGEKSAEENAENIKLIKIQ